MQNNPYMNSFYGMNGFMPMAEPPKQQPIQNIFTSQMPTGNDMFMAKFLKQGEKAEDVFVNQKTAFIDLNNQKLSIKELDGNITSYKIVLPLDEKDMKILELEKQINSLKEMMSNGHENVKTSNEITEQNGDGKKPSRK